MNHGENVMIRKDQLEAIMTDNNVTKLSPPPVLSPGNYLQQAIAAGAGIDVIERILAAQTSWDAMQAKRAYSAAIAAFKANPPKVLKDVEVNFGGGKASYKHEDLAALLAIVDPALAQHGLWVRYKVKTEDNGRVKVICVLGHADGHSEDAAELSSVPDTSGGKNPIQAIGSAVSYLQRYTTKAALGLAAAKDDDGRASGSPAAGLSSEQIDKI